MLLQLLRADDYIIHPLYVIFPKPSSLNAAVSKVVTGESTVSLSQDPNDLDSPSLEVDLWGAIWTNAIFVGVLLALGCLYVARKDF